MLVYNSNFGQWPGMSTAYAHAVVAFKKIYIEMQGNKLRKVSSLYSFLSLPIGQTSLEYIYFPPTQGRNLSKIKNFPPVGSDITSFDRYLLT